MSDLLLKGKNPASAEGEEFFLHSADWWWDILGVLTELLGNRFPEDLVFRDGWLTPPTPHFEEKDAVEVASVIEQVAPSEKRKEVLRRMYNDDPNIEEIGDQLESRIEERDEQIEQFVAFLKASGGCGAYWHGI